MPFFTLGVETSLWMPPLAAFVISLLTSMGGMSGAFLLLPFQMTVLGITSPSVSATNQLFNVVAIPSGVYRYIREQRMVWPLVWTVIVGTLPGVMIGAVIRIWYLPNPKNFKLFVAIVLGYIGLRMLRDVWAHAEKKSEQVFRQAVKNGLAARIRVREFSRQHIRYEFGDELHSCSTGTIFLLCLFVGVIGGAYGIGGGAIVAPFFVSICDLPVYTIAGATLMSTLATSVAGVIIYQILDFFQTGQSVAPDWSLGLLFGLGGMGGMYCGARLQKHVPSRLIKGMLCVLILGTAGKYVVEFFG